MKKRIIFHVDVNNAFLSWTAVKLLRDGYKTDIRNIASVIGGDESKRHGIVLAKSPVAKKYGIVTAETLYSARKKCSNLKVFLGDYELYKESSNKLFKYLSNYTPEIEIYSIDECFMDMTNTSYIYKDLLSLAYKIKDEIKEKFGFTVNVGIGNNKLCAKMASDFEKPDKVHTLFKEEIEEKIWNLPVNELYMIGKKSATKLKELGIKTIGELAKTNINFLKKYFKSFANTMWEYANGIDDSPVETEITQNKSISISKTLTKDTDNILEIRKILRMQADEIGRTLRKQSSYAQVVAIIIKTKDFVSYSKQKKLENATSVSEEIYNHAESILMSNWNYEKIRSIGIRLADFSEKREQQVSIFDKDTTYKDDKMQQTIDKINDKYGTNAITSASLLDKNKNKK